MTRNLSVMQDRELARKWRYGACGGMQRKCDRRELQTARRTQRLRRIANRISSFMLQGRYREVLDKGLHRDSSSSQIDKEATCL